MGDETLTEIKVALAKIEVSTSNTDHRVRNLEMKLQGFIDDKALEPLRSRLGVLESFQTWVQRGALGAAAAAAAAAMASVMASTKKIGL